MFNLNQFMCRIFKEDLRSENNNTAVYQSLESLSKTVTSPSHSSHSDHQRFPTPLPKSRVVVVVFEMLINYSELQVFVCWSCLRSAHYANAPKFISWFLCCHICFKVWACLIVHYCSLLHANLYTNIPFGNYFPNQSCWATILRWVKISHPEPLQLA